MTLQTAFESFMFEKHLHGLSDKSLYNYRCFITPFVLVCDKSVETLTYQDVQRYILQLMERELARATLSTYIRNLKIFVRWLCDNYGCPADYRRIKVPKSPKKTLDIYSEEDIRLIFDSVQTSVSWVTIRNRAIISLMLDAGVRQNEVCTLLRKNVHVREQYVKVFGKGQKERIVSIGKVTIAFFRKYWSKCPFESSYAFVSHRGEQVTTDSVKHMMYKMSKRLPFEFSSHKLRHNFATNYCLDQYERYGRIDIYRLMVLMGHEEINTTRRYLHVANQVIATRENLSHMDKIFWKSHNT
ncbi:tyrosine-type recombinase/integrase [Ruminococcus sp. OA3]|uniref:tyrosine-type recombinase/integrase n=1 Tax=Ruminococcus sp. OA3 TaxID=2914164 RepID=UPI001F0608B9|nr:tyrosine-type recombinase/integrase [Ruminococcus sp. OA3]MCH1981784.1 tyrosine-type recombinase/integrase [Ruminococcus sp. OA3]